MLGPYNLQTIISTAKPEEARAFYRDRLGLSLIADDGFALVFDANGRSLRISRVEVAQPPPYSSIGWEITDRPIAEVARDLVARGIVFERFPGMEQDDLGLWHVPGAPVAVAWFKDPDGNLLSISGQ